MFSLFSTKRNASIRTKVWMHTEARNRALTAWLQKHPDGCVMVWFPEDKKALAVFVPAHQICEADRVASASMTGRPTVFINRYPLASVESATLERLGISKTEYFCALDSPLFSRFGGEKIAAMMQQFGMKEWDYAEHSLIDGAVAKTQEKLAQKAVTEYEASSEAEWLELNAQMA